ncbi:MAG: hypothetical protein MJA84_08585, partial [Firmicutes bacterium]|nr:hypothetical protein [Bacillota bacterium]
SFSFAKMYPARTGRHYLQRPVQFQLGGGECMYVNISIHDVAPEQPGIHVAWGQMETFGTRRSRVLFRRLGWEFYDQKKFTKYKYLFGGAPPPNLKK